VRNSTAAVIATAEGYLRALRDKDLRAVPFAPGVTLESPLTSKLTGIEPVVAFLTGFFPAIKDVRITRVIADGEFVALMFDLDTIFGVIPVVDCIRVANGLIHETRPYYDPRPITEGVVE
jgi:limonene-1,2-epoxide hydrolase